MATNPYAVLEPLPVFVYGTLRTGQRNWQRLLAGRTVHEQPATAPNHVMYADGIAFIGDGAGTVVGDLLTLDPARSVALMRDLDQLEGITDPATGRGLGYCRVQRPVLVGDTPVRAWLYHGSPATLAAFAAQGDTFVVLDGDWVAWCAQRPGRQHRARRPAAR